MNKNDTGFCALVEIMGHKRKAVGRVRGITGPNIQNEEKIMTDSNEKNGFWAIVEI